MSICAAIIDYNVGVGIPSFPVEFPLGLAIAKVIPTQYCRLITDCNGVVTPIYKKWETDTTAYKFDLVWTLCISTILFVVLTAGSVSIYNAESSSYTGSLLTSTLLTILATCSGVAGALVSVVIVGNLKRRLEISQEALEEEMTTAISKYEEEFKALGLYPKYYNPKDYHRKGSFATVVFHFIEKETTA